MTAALQDLMSDCFNTYPVLLFLQQHMFGIRDNQTVQNNYGENSLQYYV